MRRLGVPLFAVLCAACPPNLPAASPGATEPVLLESNIENTVFYVDKHKVGIGKYVRVLVSDDGHRIKAVPPGYSAKELVVQPPYDDRQSHQFTFLIEDKVDADEPATVRPAKAPPLAVADVGRSASPQPTAYAIVIGVERYAEHLPPPTGARRDAETFAAMLTKTLGVPATHLHLDLDEHATKGAIERDIEWVKNNVPKGGRVYFYFSGHGSPAPDGTSYLVPHDGDPAYLAQTAIPLSRITKELGATPAKEVIAVLDSCFSGAGGRSVLPPGARPLVSVKATEQPATIALFSASGETEISGPTADGTGGLFTKYVIDALKNGQADADGDGAVSLDELTQWVSPRVAREAQKANRAQTPKLTSGVPSKDTLFAWGFPQK
jgi:hypothetical protein